MTQDTPEYSDVRDTSDGFQAWRRTYEYRGIKYDIAFLHRHPSRWFVVESPEASRRIGRLVARIDIRHDFLYHVCDQYEPWKDLFYEAVDLAKKDIDWFLDDLLTDLAIRMKHDNTMYQEVVSEIRRVGD